ncbi:MAG: RNA 2',3'-cyclic phosphodiesterase [Candidatus Cloacimonetes bacterium]|nr:RNA 2',3'-cyclic phosphodiesterase [Candidatus Cloacimonadota bacterium]MCF7813184.1 RNA 2',3'-cyclic phosphodiesterase [Candidatus Cloacimonadota bacterium]MCF7867632.1 RNA 2',3'-cyclic phosphodiesterase [Candidatus Cloacimonadota bacterium]MCF7883093.1 RNA 2',3'-cyclic phosphodiesterase [Candidatus Cloacimonadota bacterium]
MRTFLALDLPDPIRQIISSLSSELQSLNVSGINWVESENLHITFQFIGDTHQHHILEITDFLEDIFSQMQSIHFSEPKLQIIPQRDPRIIWLSLQTNHKKIFQASRKIKEKLLEMGYKLDKKPLKFHITLGRIKKRLPKFFIQKILTTELKTIGFDISEAALYQSFLRPEGPVYDKIVKYEF